MKYFITFATKGIYQRRANTLISEIKKLNIFDEIIMITDEDLKADTSFWKRHSNFIENNERGYGYWLWKSYIILKYLKQINNDDILLYFDAGVTFRSSDSRFKELFKIVKKDFVIGSFCRMFCDEYKWNKMDLVHYLNLNDNKYLKSRQRQAGAIILVKNEKTVQLINKWYEISCIYHLIDDSKSIHKNKDGFIEHRHDQSIFSLLTKKYNLYSNTDMFTFLNIYIDRRTRKV